MFRLAAIILLSALQALTGQRILFVEREQYPRDHHNTATMFMRGEVNEGSFTPGAALCIYDLDKRTKTVLLSTEEGLIRDPELSYDATKVIFSMRPEKNDGYHIYEIGIDGKGLRQLTEGRDIADIDPVYLPDGKIAFSSTRQQKYCMCNQHIMYNLYTMNPDGSGINQIGVSTLAEGHASVMSDGRLIYDRWEYVDRNFADAQSLWTVNPDGTKHSVFYGNNTNAPAGSLEPRQIPGTGLIVCTMGACHSRPWGAIAILDHNKGIDGKDPVVHIWPSDAIEYINSGNYDITMTMDTFYEDPWPLDKDHIMASRTMWIKRNYRGDTIRDCKMGVYILGTDGSEELLFESDRNAFDPQVIAPRPVPPVIPTARRYDGSDGTFFVENVYWGTHMKGVEPGSVKYLRVIESPEKRTHVPHAWSGEGTQWPGMNWHGFENKRILGEVEVEEDGSVMFNVPSGKFVYFQLLDKDKKMIQSMRSGASLMPGEINGCIGCHEDRLSAPEATDRRPLAFKSKPATLKKWHDREPFLFSFMQEVQPILDNRCVSCHDFNSSDRDRIVLAKDKNPFFNAAYVDLYVKKAVKLPGGGPAETMQPYSWGAHASKLTQIIDGKHHGVQLSKDEKETLYTWMDLNGVYYPIYETAFQDHPAGRSPLTYQETNELASLTGLNFGALGDWRRTQQAQISFDRPELSPCLDAVKDDPEKYNRVLEIIRIGGERLKETPRGDIESQIVVCPMQQAQLDEYNRRVQSVPVIIEAPSSDTASSITYPALSLFWSGTSPLHINGMTKMDGLIYTSESGLSRVAAYRPGADAPDASWDLPDRPTGIASADGMLYITTDGAEGGVECMFPDRLGKRKFIATGRGACAPLAIGGKLYVCNRFSGTVSEVDPANGRKIRDVRTVREPVASAISPDGRKLFVLNYLPDGTADGKVHGACVSVIDTDSFTVIKNIELVSGSNALQGITLSPDGKEVLVSHNLARYQIPTTQLQQGWMNTAAMSIIDIDKLSCKGTVILDEIDKAASGAWGITSSGNKVVIAHSGTHELSVIEWTAFKAKLDQYKDKSFLPNDMRLLVGCRDRVRIEGNGPRELLASDGKVYINTYFSDIINILDTQSLDMTSKAINAGRSESPAERGEKYFNDASLCFQNWQSCSSCHPGGARADALDWDNLNDGIGNAKQTRSLLYSMQTPPSMISGIRKDAETAVRAGFVHIQMHEPSDEVLSSVCSYLTGIEAEPSPYLVKGKLSAKARKGYKLFKEWGCAECHNGQFYTDGKKYHIGKDVEFDEGWDTPTLREVWRTAPYLFDGRAATMEEVFSVHRHGLQNIETTPEQIDQLVEYVNSL